MSTLRRSSARHWPWLCKALLRLLAQHKMPRPQDSPVKTGRLPMGNIKGLLRSHEIVMAKLASGAITPVQTMQIDSATALGAEARQMSTSPCAECYFHRSSGVEIP